MFVLRKPSKCHPARVTRLCVYLACSHSIAADFTTALFVQIVFPQSTG